MRSLSSSPSRSPSARASPCSRCGGDDPPRAAASRPVLDRHLGRHRARCSARCAAAARDLRPALADAYLQRVRETGDPSFYARAEGVLGHAAHADGLRDRGRARARATRLPGRARAAAVRPATLGAPIRVDALVELGRYAEAERELQAMIDRKPNLAGYARVSYLRELHGDLAGAAERDAARRRRRRAVAENVAYVSALLGELERRRGRDGAARRAFRRALAAVPGFPARRGRARPARAAGTARASRRVVERLPLPEYVIALGETELAAGGPGRARRSRSSPPSSGCCGRRGAASTVDAELARLRGRPRGPGAGGRCSPGGRGRPRRACARRTRSGLGADAQRQAGRRWPVGRRRSSAGRRGRLGRRARGLRCRAAGRCALDALLVAARRDGRAIAGAAHRAQHRARARPARVDRAPVVLGAVRGDR